VSPQTTPKDQFHSILLALLHAKAKRKAQMARKSSLRHQAKTRHQTDSDSDLPFKPSRRDEVLNAVREGRMLPHEADADAKANGYTLAHEPNPTKFDPMKEARWSLPMALAWIMWRTSDEVREMWDAAREERRFWQDLEWQEPGGPVRNGYSLKQSEPATFFEVEFASRYPTTPPQLDFKTALADLRLKAIEGKIEATGIPSGSEIRTAIRSDVWNDLKPKDQKHRGHDRPMLVLINHCYREVRVPRDKVLATWKAPSKANINAKSTGAKIKDCQKWLEEQMRNSPEERPKKKADYEADALEQFPGLRAHGFGFAWRAAVQATGASAWSQGGRPAETLKSKNQKSE
jgi:hypothetical protein